MSRVVLWFLYVVRCLVATPGLFYAAVVRTLHLMGRGQLRDAATSKLVVRDFHLMGRRGLIAHHLSKPDWGRALHFFMRRRGQRSQHLNFFIRCGGRPRHLSFLLLVGLLCLVGCASAPPYRDYVIAHTALQAAKKSEAPQLAARQWQQAQALYRQGVALWQRQKYEKAQKFFLNARRQAEQAENLSRLKKHRSDDL